jgi:hypothetical protein
MFGTHIIRKKLGAYSAVAKRSFEAFLDRLDEEMQKRRETQNKRREMAQKNFSIKDTHEEPLTDTTNKKIQSKKFKEGINLEGVNSNMAHRNFENHQGN